MDNDKLLEQIDDAMGRQGLLSEGLSDLGGGRSQAEVEKATKAAMQSIKKWMNSTGKTLTPTMVKYMEGHIKMAVASAVAYYGLHQ
jgi:hypothetical protein